MFAALGRLSYFVFSRIEARKKRFDPRNRLIVAATIVEHALERFSRGCGLKSFRKGE